MLLNILLFLLSLLHLHPHRIPDKHRWNIKYLSNTNGGEFDRVIIGYDFDLGLYEEEVPLNVCDGPSIPGDVKSLSNYSGYVYCTSKKKGILQKCPSDTKISYKIGGCVNQTTNTTVFPVGSRCASRPCQNGGICFDFRSADGYQCLCRFPYEGLHCHLLQTSLCDCGGDVGQIVSRCKPFTNDKALDYICTCTNWTIRPVTWKYAMNNCHTDELFDIKCDEEARVGALPFTNKGFYFCPWSVTSAVIQSCPLHHVWNDTVKECVVENN